MNSKLILLRFGELTLKGKNRSRFENRLLQQIRGALRDFRKIGIKREYGRVYVELNGEPYEPIARALQKIFGLHSFSPVVRTEPEVSAIQQAALNLMRELPQIPGTFKVSVKRVDKTFPAPSQEMNHLVGSYVLPRFPDLKVDVRQPQFELRVEIRESGAYLFSEIVPAAGGYPSGTNGKSMLMLSGGIDSPVAGWLAMRKGLAIEAVHFHSYPYTSERAVQKVKDLVSVLSTYGGKIDLHLVPFTDIQVKLRDNSPDNLLITLMRRAMLRITEAIAGEREAKAIVTGDSLGQVASQTLSSLFTIGQVTGLPILRPLITMDKTEIITIAEKIKTYSISIRPYEDCCTLFVPKSPSTNPNLRVVERVENQWGDMEEDLREAVERTETVSIHHELPNVYADLF